MADESQTPLEEQVVERVREWFKRAALNLGKSEYDATKLEIILTQPGAEDDGTLFVEARFVETVELPDAAGIVPGVKYTFGDAG